MHDQINKSVKKFVIDTIHHYLPKAVIFAFGSRIRGTALKYSDLDLAVLDEKPIDLLTLSTVREVFSNSNLPMRIDIVDLNTVSEEFKKIIETTSVRW